MGLCSTISKILRRSKYVVLLILSLSVLAWIAMFPGETVKSSQDRPVTSQTLVRGNDLRNELDSQTAAPTGLITPKQTADCPQESPLLHGAVALTFDSSLKMNKVENENKEMTEGEYEPSDCKARHNVAILIPHRNRERHLLYLLHHLHPFLQRQQLHYAIYVIHQAGDVTFNRAKLLNVGYLEALKDYDWDCFIFHDVDLVPENDHNLYICDKEPKHLVVGRNVTGYKLRYKGYFGGVTAMTRDQFLQVNGFSNSYWGWGGEDDDLRIRVELQKMKIVRPPADVARYTMVFHKRDSGNQINTGRMKLLGQTPHMWRKDGLNSCSYKTLAVERLPLYVNVTVDIEPTRTEEIIAMLRRSLRLQTNGYYNSEGQPTVSYRETPLRPRTRRQNEAKYRTRARPTVFSNNSCRNDEDLYEAEIIWWHILFLFVLFVFELLLIVVVTQSGSQVSVTMMDTVERSNSEGEKNAAACLTPGPAPRPPDSAPPPLVDCQVPPGPPVFTIRRLQARLAP